MQKNNNLHIMMIIIFFFISSFGYTNEEYISGFLVNPANIKITTNKHSIHTNDTPSLTFNLDSTSLIIYNGSPYSNFTVTDNIEQLTYTGSYISCPRLIWSRSSFYGITNNKIDTIEYDSLLNYNDIKLTEYSFDYNEDDKLLLSFKTRGYEEIDKELYFDDLKKYAEVSKKNFFYSCGDLFSRGTIVINNDSTYVEHIYTEVDYINEKRYFTKKNDINDLYGFYWPINTSNGRVKLQIPL